jgi:hypothetical protein
MLGDEKKDNYGDKKKIYLKRWRLLNFIEHMFFNRISLSSNKK